MQKIVCSCCGAHEFERKTGFLVCSYCGTLFHPDAVEMGDGESIIGVNQDIERLLQKCRSDAKNAKKYANLVLDIDPSNIEALKYL